MKCLYSTTGNRYLIVQILDGRRLMSVGIFESFGNVQ